VSIGLQQTPAANSSGGTSLLTVTPGSGFTNGNGIVVVVGSVSRAPSSVTDDNGVSLTQVRTTNFFGSPYCSIYYLSSVSGSPTAIKVNFSSSTSCTATVYEVQGQITAHAGNANSANTTTASAGSFSTTTADTIAFGGLQDNTITSAPSGYTLDTNTNSCGSAHTIYTTTQSGINPTWANSSGGTACAIEAFTSTNPNAGIDVSTSQGFGLGASYAPEPWTTQGFSLGATMEPEPYVKQGFALGATMAPVELFGRFNAGMMFGGGPDADKSAAAGFSLGAQFTLDAQYTSATAGLALGSRAASDSGDLANGRYRR
jgi:hypothetical protein